MTTVSEQFVTFLTAAGWQGATAQLLPADFSTRRFWRLSQPGHSAILMQAPPEQKTPEFLLVAALLRQAGIAAPEIYAADAAQGLVLMQDFGDANLGKLLDDKQAGEAAYRPAVELLAQLHQFFPAALAGNSLPQFNAALFAEQSLWFIDDYWPYAKGCAADAATRESFRTLWHKLLRPLEQQPHSLLLRDFMPDNLMRLADSRLGVLDFQDAGWGSVAYDIASLCECVRRDCPLARLEAMIDCYLTLNPVLGRAELRRACFLLAAQRHLRILGNLARFAEDPQKNFRLNYLPRIWRYLEALLQQDGLAPLAKWLRAMGFVPQTVSATARGPQPAALSDTAMVLAAGLGTRMRPLTLTKPKPLQEIGGRTMLDLALDRLKTQGIRRVIVNTHYLAAQITTHLKARSDLEIIISHEPDLLDTGGGIKNVLPEFGGKPFFVLSADLPLIDGPVPALQRMAEAWDPTRMDTLLLVMPTAQARGFDGNGDYYMCDDGADPTTGVIPAQAGIHHRNVTPAPASTAGVGSRVKPGMTPAESSASAIVGQLYRHNTQPPRPYVMISAQIMKPELFTAIAAQKFSNSQLWDELETQGRLYGLVHDGTCYHVGTPHDLAEANRLLTAGSGWAIS